MALPASTRLQVRVGTLRYHDPRGFAEPTTNTILTVISHNNPTFR